MAGGQCWGRARAVLAAFAAAALVAGCSNDGGLNQTKSGIEVVGHVGRQPGLFSRPRAVDVTSTGLMAVVDRTGRLQIFNLATLEFVRQWRFPAWDNGTPTGMTIDPVDDSIWVADTHYNRILHYDLEGKLLAQFGSAGEEPGHFVFPTDVCPDPDGKFVWVTDYGRRNRVMQFQRDGTFVKEWGTELFTNADLDRPQALSLSPDGQQLLVVDAGNHRINVYDRDGKLVRHIGSAGSGPGQLKYPYDLAVAPDGSYYIAEFGNHRVSHFAADGSFLGVLGGPGNGPGEFASPWGVAVAPDGTVVIADTNNQRLQIVRRPERVFRMEAVHVAATANSPGDAS